MAAPTQVPFVGGSYELARKKMDVQRAINLFPTPVESGGGKSPLFLKSVAGLDVFSLPANTYYTSLVYPYLITDTISTGIPVLERGYQFFLNPDAMNQPITSLQSGTLVVSLNPVSYTNQRDINPDVMNHPIASLQSGTLIVTISYLSYTNQRDVNPDVMNHPIASLQSGTLVVTIGYVDYTHQRDVNPDTMNHPVTSLQSGTLV